MNPSIQPLHPMRNAPPDPLPWDFSMPAAPGAPVVKHAPPSSSSSASSRDPPRAASLLVSDAQIPLIWHICVHRLGLYRTAVQKRMSGNALFCTSHVSGRERLQCMYRINGHCTRIHRNILGCMGFLVVPKPK